MKIVVDARTVTDHFPGIGRYTVNLLRGLASSEWAPSVSQLYGCIGGDRLSLPALPVIECPSSPFSLSQQWTIPRVLERTEADLYHSPYYGMPLNPGIPSVVTCHDLIPLIYPQYFTVRQRWVYRIANALVFRRVRRIISVSDSTKSDLVRIFNVDPAKVVTTHLGVSRRFFEHKPEETKRVREAYNLPERYVLYVGANKPHKNLPALVDAWQSLRKRQEKLVIAGHWDGRYNQSVEKVRLNGLENEVRFLGPVSDDHLPALYGGADVFVFPSHYEGFGLPVLEAMASGTAVVCSNIPSFREIGGSSVVMVDPYDVNDISGKIEMLLDDSAYRDRLGSLGARRAADFTWDRTVRQTLSVYRDALSS